MRVLELSKDSEFGILTEAVQVLKSGGVLLAPTDTVYGLLGDATNPETIKKIFSLKTRDAEKPTPVFVNSFKMLDEVAFVKYDKIKNFLDKFWPGKITAVLPTRGWMPMEARGAGGLTIGVRIPDYPFLTLLIKSFGKPVTATSANISGKKEHLSAEEAINEFKHLPFKPDLAIAAGELPESKVSTVVDLTVDEPRILREGAISEEEIIKIWKETN